MAGLYFHIPFCRQACVYCDFHFSTSTRDRSALLQAMDSELRQRVAGTEAAAWGSIYFGGGTPSLLEPKELEALLRTATELAPLETGAELTLEANPDDITLERLSQWRDLGINRISLGVQSFRADRLQWMGRAHNDREALAAIAAVAKAGFRSWTIDLIYGLPGMDIAEWDAQLSTALEHGMPHLSAYCLTVEERTALHHQVRQGRIVPANDAQQADQFQHLITRMEDAGRVQYEISNFALPGHFAQHNTRYWQGVPYIGIGPSAHSYNGQQRRWNVANNARYIKGLNDHTPYWDHEDLSAIDRTNERLLTGLRTMWGVELATLEHDVLSANRSAVDRWVQHGSLLLHDGHLLLSREGRNYADRIASDLFLSP